ncbi:plancitoxin-1-like [Agrilus planipennis]|uniref:Plancitoxin-1 n=1 Tax=Agrilus planipennis TaxID=224129 RepID=A0A7F5RGD4_AGRPL|nr:plancitoxin-1 [Agrilus planipennis]XP_025835052.1 plancitoxin-1-like [Agrilus planipennis]
MKNLFNLILLLSLLCEVLCYQCVDLNNKPVDWFYAYKLPLESKHENTLIATGAAYTYMTSNNYRSGWILSPKSINDTDSLVGLTLKPVFDLKNTNNGLYILYNDEQPEGTVNFRKGHTKGTILANEKGGLWLLHSVPKFPSTNAGSYFYPHNGYQYGQSFLCISFDLINLNLIGKQLQYNEPFIYEHNIPDSLMSTLPNIVDVINGRTMNGSRPFNLVNLNSINGTKFWSFAKGKHFNKDLYEDWVAPAFNSSLLVETWLNGAGRLPSDCKRMFHVQNIESLTIKIANLSFSSSNDHSKWAVTPSDNSQFWTCIGDINRAKPQEKRGGGTVCFSNKNIAAAYQTSITTLENCN